MRCSELLRASRWLLPTVTPPAHVPPRPPSPAVSAPSSAVADHGVFRRRSHIMFPEPVHYSRTDCPAGWKIRDWDTANKLLSYFDPERRPFAIFALLDNSYIQCLGSKRRLTVEARQYRPDGSFTHWVFGRGAPLREPQEIAVSTGISRVDISQILAMRDARIIIRQFLETRTFPSSYYRQDVTRRFTTNRDA